MFVGELYPSRAHPPAYNRYVTEHCTVTLSLFAGAAQGDAREGGGGNRNQHNSQADMNEFKRQEHVKVFGAVSVCSTCKQAGSMGSTALQVTFSRSGSIALQTKPGNVIATANG